MKKAWNAYKLRWEQEEEYRRNLEEKKLVYYLLSDQTKAI